MAMELIDALEWVRSRPQQFFGRDKPDPVHLLAYLMADVVELGKGECLIRRSVRWWIVGSDFDWLTNVPCDISELFRRVVPAPQHGRHSMRGEVLLGAFCPDISVVGADGLMRVAGSEPEEAALLKTNGMRRAILFRLP